MPCDGEGIARTLNNPIRLGFAKPRRAGKPPGVGEHSEEILKEAGYEAAEIAAMKSKGVVG